MADFVFVCADIIQRIIGKVQEIKSLPKDCQKLASIVTKLKPVYLSLEIQLRDNEHRQLMEMLSSALVNAELVVDYIIEHPKYAAIRSGKYKHKLEDAMKDINDWILRIQPLTSGESLKGIDELKSNVSDFVVDLHNMRGELLDNFDNLTKDLTLLKEIRNELLPLVKNKEKDPKFAKFIDEEEARMLQMAETNIAKQSGALNSLFCPITGVIMEDPIFCVSSGISYDRIGMDEHVAQCFKQHQRPYDPLTRVVIKDPYEDLKSNITLRNVIEEYLKSEDSNIGMSHTSMDKDDDKVSYNEFELQSRQWEIERSKNGKILIEYQEKNEKLVADYKMLAIEFNKLDENNKELKRELALLKHGKEATNPKPNLKVSTELDTSSSKLVRTMRDFSSACKLWVSDNERALEMYGHISDWDTSAITSMNSAFRDQKKFNDDISRWDVSNVTDMFLMFLGNYRFNCDLSKWNVSKVTNMERMFEDCFSFTSDLSQWDVSNVETTLYMFLGCKNFESDLSGWNMSNVMNCERMFGGAIKFKSNIEKWDLSNVLSGKADLHPRIYK
jgi:surface protein